MALPTEHPRFTPRLTDARKLNTVIWSILLLTGLAMLPQLLPLAYSYSLTALFSVMLATCGLFAAVATISFGALANLALAAHYLRVRQRDQAARYCAGFVLLVMGGLAAVLLWRWCLSKP